MSDEKTVGTNGTGKKGRILIILLGISILAMFIGSAIARGGQTAFGAVEVEEIQIINDNGATQHALLYLPENIGTIAPVPGVVAIHGYSANNEAMELHAIELARRGVAVLAIDAYDHGASEPPDPGINLPVDDLGAYSALQYLGRLSFVDRNNLGFIGHSMGCQVSQSASLRAYELRKTDPSVVVPRAVLLTSNSFKLNAEGEEPINQYPINYAVASSDYDEFTILFWGVIKGTDFTKSPAFAKGMGFEGAQVGSFYAYGNSTPLNRTDAIAAARRGVLRASFSIPHTHSIMTFSKKAVRISLNFFDITLAGGALEGKIPYDNQLWRWKNVGGGLAIVGFFVFVISLALFLLKLPYFKTLIHPEPPSLTTVKSVKDRLIYVIFYIIMVGAPALLYVWCVGVTIYSTHLQWDFQGILRVNRYFQLPTLNGVVAMNLILSVFYAAFVVAVYYVFAKKQGATWESAGLRVSRGELGKSLLLAVIVFFAGYVAVSVFNYFFKVDFGFWKFIVRVMPSYKWSHFLRYLPFYFVYFVVTGVLVNAVTRINNQKEWVNFALIIFATVGGLLIHQIYDYAVLSITGSRGVFWVPGSGKSMPNMISGIFLYGLLFVLPIIAVIARLFYKKTGRVWVGSFLNALLITFYGVCTAMIGQVPV
ncbi:MAG: alpha/beta fold hydrolase [Treponema sp.]|jgi:pimeloyl-ACP methyl ester carboxylesterase|nr:alpha/beta fold hydrolase [Treponema sp.]